MGFLKKVFAIGLLSLLLISCKDQKKIDELTLYKSNVTSEISYKYDEIKKGEKSIDSLKGEIKKLYLLIDEIGRNVDFTIKDSPMASAYIHEFDKEPIDILQEYINTSDDDHRNFLLFAHIVLIIYGQGNQDVIETVRKKLRDFDEQKRSCMARITYIEQGIKLRQGSISSYKEQITVLGNRVTELENEINKLNN